MPSLTHNTRRRQVQSAPPASGLQSPAFFPRGLTVIEMLIATAITLVMMAAVVNLFANLSDGIRNRRAVIEVSSHLRQVRQRLARDLAGCTVPLAPQGLVPWQRAGEAIGYFEIVEGEHSDADPSELTDGIDNPGAGNYEIDYGSSLVPGSQLANVNAGVSTDARGLGDWDDILALTVRSDSEPFVGSYDIPNPASSGAAGYPDPTNDDHWISKRVESSLAEVVWYADETLPGNPAGLEPGMRHIYRRVALIAPWIESQNLRQLASAAGGLQRFLTTNDLSVRRDDSGLITTNTLAELTRREYRLGRGRTSVYPFPFDRSRLSFVPKHLMLSDALAFDVRVYDPGAPLFQVAATGTPSASAPIVQPSDAGWDRLFGTYPLARSIVGFGAYVDLGWDDGPGGPQYNYGSISGAPVTHFQQRHEPGWHPTIPTYFRGETPVYDTWSWHYENNQLDEETLLTNSAPLPAGTFALWQTNTLDQGTNGVDDELPNGINGVDDIMERETSPPYTHPLRGVKVLFRLYERDARQVREASVTHSFVP